MQAEAVYIAAQGFEAELEEELRRGGRRVLFRRGALMGATGSGYPAVWAQNVWYEPRLLPAPSISLGAAALKSIQRNWALFPSLEHRRAALIQEALPRVSARPQVFGAPAPNAPLGSWTMWSKDAILASAVCSSPFVHGRVRFAEDKTGPPNRAYLKLWETFTRLGRSPGSGDLCLDLGSSPGGWTWVLAGLGARVFSVDKAPLEDGLGSHPLVEYCAGSAFAFSPEQAGNVSWLFCDVACYPERLLTLVRAWLDKGECGNFICTVKFAGKTDFAVLDAFLAIPGSAARHLYHNKHEVTWMLLREGGEHRPHTM